jgi:hypothetical protein
MVLVDVWDEVFEDYDWTPASRSYRLMSVGEAFADYLAGHAVVQERWPYLPDLARYEWVQACLLSYPDTTYPESRLKVMPESEDQLALMVPVLNQASALLELSYPIPSLVSLLKSDPETRLSPDFLSPRSTLVWMYRSFDRPFRCRSFEVSSVLAAWLNSLQSHPNALLSYLDSIQPVYSHIASQMPGLTPGLFYSQFIPMLTQLLENGIVLGSCFIGAVSGEEPL